MIEVMIPIRTVSEANSTEHWTKKSKRHRQQQFFVRQYLKDRIKEVALPCTVTITRLSPRKLDDDNLIMCLKYVRDEIGSLIFPEKVKTYINSSGSIVSNKGHSDSDNRIKWFYEQEKSKKQAIRIRIENDT